MVYHNGTGQNVFGVVSFRNAYISEIDSMGIILKGMQEKQETVWQPAEGDSVKALIYTEELGFRRIVVERDSFSIIKKVVDAIEDESVSAALIKENSYLVWRIVQHTKWHRKEKGSTLRCFGSRKHQKKWKEYQLWTEGEWAEKKFREYLSKIMKNVSLDEMKTQRIRRERPEQDYRKQSYQKYRSTPATNTDEETKGILFNCPFKCGVKVDKAIVTLSMLNSHF
ncbi:hypothetical protein PVK06_039124 [Gossypium arboreum]|uniref:RNase H type-1 domain-containing protein n=1 Tax=Gossypium arboreum TaxID=29729 RepID=A0ABR0N227_GOSAR|nr:hypothetical protein PVK06_039124 [Gossypium arboreum]